MHRLKTLAVAAVLGLALLALAGPAMASGGRGAVYTLTNSASGNAVAVFDRAADGSLTPDSTVATGGLGTGAGLGSQGALVLDDDRLFAVNAGDNTISMLRVGHRGHGQPDGRCPLRRRQADQPHGPRQARLRLERRGCERRRRTSRGSSRSSAISIPLPGSSRPLSSAAAGPGAGRVQPERASPRRHRKGDEHDRHLQGRVLRLRERPERRSRPPARRRSASLSTSVAA